MLVAEQEGQNRLAALRDALGVLNPRERRIFEARRLADDPITLEELSTEFGVSRERVRQIEVRAFEKVQEAVQEEPRRPRGAARRGAGLARVPVRPGGQRLTVTAAGPATGGRRRSGPARR